MFYRKDKQPDSSILQRNIYVRRIDCWNDTQTISSKIPSPPKSSKIKYDNNFFPVKKFKSSTIRFFNMDSIDCCLQYSPKALVLNLADEIYPGGCVQMGSGAQEEALFRRTNYCSSLKVELYPLQKNEAIYSSQISVIKENEKREWLPCTSSTSDLSGFRKISFVACAGLNHPDIGLNNESEQVIKSDTDIEKIKIKIKTIIQIAVQFNHDTIIFGALGCGAFANPPKHVAQIFREVLKEYDGVIQNYFFAILHTHDDTYRVRKKTVDVFKNVFEMDDYVN
jgi:uncharacterized protein (TIGR02452 family)